MRAIPVLTILVLLAMSPVWAQFPPAEGAKPKTEANPPVPAEASKPGVFQIDIGTRVPLALINSISTKNASNGDRVYLETVFPILANGRVVIPPGSYVSGTITDVRRPGKVKGRGEFYIRFDALTLPNGVTRDFRARVSAIDGTADDRLEKKEGKVQSEPSKGKDAAVVGQTTAAGASAGALIGLATKSPGMGAGIGAAAGAAAGLVAVLLTRGNEAVLAKGTTLEMVMDRMISFDEADLDFSNTMPSRGRSSQTPPSQQKLQQRPWPGTNRWPL